MRRFSTCVLCVAVVLGFVPARAAKKDASPSIARRLDSARSVALTVQSDIAQLAELVRTRGDWQVNGPSVDQLRGDVQVAEGSARELAELRVIASPAEESVIPKVTSLLRELAGNARDIVDHLNATECSSRPEVCMEYIAGHQEIGDHLASLIVEEVNRTQR